MEKNRSLLTAAAVGVPLIRGPFRGVCEQCGVEQGGYAFLARNLIRVEPLPDSPTSS